MFQNTPSTGNGLSPFASWALFPLSSSLSKFVIDSVIFNVSFKGLIVVMAASLSIPKSGEQLDLLRPPIVE